MNPLIPEVVSSVKINSKELPSKEMKAQVEIIPSKESNGQQPVKLTQEELVEVERQKQLADKMKGCPFFAGINRADALKAVEEHGKIIRRKSSNKISPVTVNTMTQ